MILSGEHAVLYGCPALSLAIQRYAHCEATWRQAAQSEYLFDLVDYNLQVEHTVSQFTHQVNTLEQRYHAFKAGDLPIAAVLTQPEELLMVAMNLFAKKHPLKQGSWHFKITSEIPNGRGLGSSAAVIVSLLSCLYKLHNIVASQVELLDLAKQVENYQHGHSSGLDPATIIFGGLITFKNGRVMEHTSPPNITAWQVDTGAPQSTTGDAVLQVKQHFASETALWQNFNDCTQQILHSLQTASLDGLPALMAQNQTLLQQIGVVPPAVTDFIHKLSSGTPAMTAKVCGSGSVAGESAGNLWVIAESIGSAETTTVKMETLEKHLQQHCDLANYSLHPLKADLTGVVCMDSELGERHA